MYCCRTYGILRDISKDVDKKYPLWLINHLIHGAFTGALNEVLAMTSIVIGMVRHDINRKPKVKDKSDTIEQTTAQ